MMGRLLLLCALLAGAPCAAADRDALTVFAAASLTDAMDEALRLWPEQVRVSYAASSTLARQIEAGAPAHLFLSADEDWLEYLAERRLIDPASRRTALGNELVLVAPADAAPEQIPLVPGADLLARLGRRGRLALGDPAHVPAGRYAQQALTWLGAWPALRDRLAPAADVRAALALVARGEAPLGIVYATDALAVPAVRVLGRFPPDSHAPIRYGIALTRDAPPRARALYDHLLGPASAAVFARHGFLPAAGN